MSEEANQREVLFKVGNREIVRNGLYTIIGPGVPSREMVVAYDPETNNSTWVQPNARIFYSDGSGLMATVINVNLFEDAFNTPKPYLRFAGGQIEFNREYRPTPEHWNILSHWQEELDKAGIGGFAPDLTNKEVRKEFWAEYGLE